MASNKYMTVDQLAGWKVRQDEVLRFEKAKEQADTEALRQQRIGYIL